MSQTAPEVVRVSEDEQAVRRKLDEEYRMACPRGHTSLHPAETTSTAYCKTCGRAYDFAELCDRRHDGVPERGLSGGP